MEVKRGCMIAVSAISDIGDKILLCNGEEIGYTKRKKKLLKEELQKKAAADGRRILSVL